MTANVTVYLPSVDRYRDRRGTAPGVLDAIQRLSFDSVEDLASHIQTYGPGLVREVLLLVTAKDGSRVGEEMDGVLKYEVGVRVRRNGPSRELARKLLEPWELPKDPTTGAQFAWDPSLLVDLHTRESKRLREDLDWMIGRSLTGRDISDRGRRVEVPLNLYVYPKAAPRLYPGKLDPDYGDPVHGGWDPEVSPTLVQPYDLARYEAALALATDGRGLAVCDTCGRFFVQTRRGDRYDRFCPGYEECSKSGRREYEKGNYRREYRRRQAALRRLQERPGVKPAEIRSAEREFEAWRTEQRELGNVRPMKESTK